MPFVRKNFTGTITVSYPAREVQLEITQAEADLVRNLSDKVIATKFIRDQYKLGLYEAKQIVDTIHSCPIYRE